LPSPGQDLSEGGSVHGEGGHRAPVLIAEQYPASRSKQRDLLSSCCEADVCVRIDRGGIAAFPIITGLIHFG
jgi:hypothetical protein